MKISGTHLKRYKEIAQLLWKYGRSDLVREMDAEDELELSRGEAPANGASPEQLADDLEAMGATFVKLGQVLSGRPDLIPEPYVEALRRNLAEFDLIRVPQPIADYSAQRVLTMEHISGTKITKLSPVVRIELPGAELAAELFRAYLKQVLVDGLFHADPHPGNIFITDDGRLALLDLGMVGHVTPSMQTSLLKILMAISGGV